MAAKGKSSSGGEEQGNSAGTEWAESRRDACQSNQNALKRARRGAPLPASLPWEMASSRSCRVLAWLTRSDESGSGLMLA
jgi:hypothetical protein